MKGSHLIAVLALLMLLVMPVSAVYEFPGRYYAGGGMNPRWNGEPGNMFLIGGYNSSFPYSGVWNDSWYSPDGSTGGVWVNSTGATVPWSARYGHKAYPIGLGWVLLTGGVNGAATQFYNTSYLTTTYGNSWTVNASPNGWRTRQGHGSTGTTTCVMISGGAGSGGGYGASYMYNDTWATFDWGTSWISRSTNPAWHARYLHAMDSNGYYAYFFGGINSSGTLENDMWKTTDCGATWTQVKANTGYGTDPAPRYNHGLVWISGSTHVLIAGNGAGLARKDVWLTSDDGATWQLQTADAEFGRREGFVSAYDPAKNLIVVAGGSNATSYYNDVWISEDLGVTWRPYYSTTYATPGQFSWTAPTGVRNVSINIAGGGGGGMSAHNGSTYAVGNGGGAALFYNISKNAVTPGGAYTISVGLNGTQSQEQTRNAYPGNPSTAFGKSAAGGAAGTQAAEETSPAAAGGYGQDTRFLTNNFLAINGSVVLGLAGRGYGAGGGGGGHSGTSPCTPGYGGSGAPGVVRIFTDGSWWDNTPDFSTTTTVSTTGTVISFIDGTKVRNNVGTYYLWNFGDGSTSTTQGNVNHSYAYPGSFTVSLSVGSATGEFTTTKENYIQITGSNSQTWYSPGQVRFTVLDYLGNNVVGATVNATYVQSTMPTAVMWLSSVYGVNSEVAAQMLSTNTVMSGTTGSDGAVVFTMHSSLQYNVSAWNSSSFIQTRIYPKEYDYNIWLPKPSVNNTYAQLGYNLTFWQPNASYFTMGAVYQDNSSLTQRVTFYVNSTNGTNINYTTMINPGTAALNITKTIPNVRGEMYYWGLDVVRSEPADKRNISLDRGVTAKGASGVLVDLRLPNVSYYQWISLFLLFLVASLSSKMNVRFMVILMPILAAFFWWFGWMSGTYLAAVIPFACLLGVVYYMKGSLRENYGIGGSGSMLINIVVYLMIFQLMIGFINGIGVFNQNSMAAASNEFTNVDLTTIQNETSNFGGINDPLQSANAFATIGWATMKIALNMIGAVFVVGYYLIEMFPYIPPEFFMILQAGIWILYVLFIVRLIGKAGGEVDL